MKDTIQKKKEEFIKARDLLLERARAHEAEAQRLRADAIATGGAIQALDQLLAEIEKPADAPVDK